MYSDRENISEMNNIYSTSTLYIYIYIIICLLILTQNILKYKEDINLLKTLAPHASSRLFYSNVEELRSK